MCHQKIEFVNTKLSVHQFVKQGAEEVLECRPPLNSNIHLLVNCGEHFDKFFLRLQIGVEDGQAPHHGVVEVRHDRACSVGVEPFHEPIGGEIEVQKSIIYK